MFVPTDAAGPASWRRCWSAIRSRASPSGRRRDDGPDAAELARRLARDAEAVCRHYLSNGRREGRYWLVGDVRNTPGRSLFVRLKGPDSGKGAAGKWTDAATGDHGDLLDVIRESCGLVDFHDVADEARRFLSLPRSEPEPDHERRRIVRRRPDRRNRRGGCSPWRSRFRAHSRKRICANAASRPCTEPEASASIPAATTGLIDDSPTQTWPAMIAAVTDLDGKITGAHRTWLDPSGRDKAPIDTPRRAMGHLLGNAVRFGVAHDCLGGRRRHRDHAVAPMRHARPCRWWPRSRPRISPPSCSRRRCAGSISLATTIRPGTARRRA